MPRRNISKRSAASHPHYRRLQVEPLEDRRMLATFTVDLLEDNTDDDGLTTLREAIAAANATVEADVIEFAPELFEEGARTLELELGEVLITDDLTIVGPGVELLTIQGYGERPEYYSGIQVRRLFRIDDGLDSNALDVEMSGLTLYGGYVPQDEGGAIHSKESLTLRYVHAVNNVGAGGGAVYSLGGALTVEDSEFRNNSSQISQASTPDDGGALLVLGSNLSVRSSQFHGHVGGSGGAVFVGSYFFCLVRGICG